jgi:hypothetical protein
MIGTDPGMAFHEKRDAMAIIAARPFCSRMYREVKKIDEFNDP